MNTTQQQIAKIMMLHGTDGELKEVLEYIGAKTQTPPSRPSYDTIHNRCIDMVKLFEGQFDLVVGVSRGGLFPGIVISHALDLPFKPIDYSAKSGNGDNKISDNHIPSWVANNQTPTRVLIVDDIADSGHTMQEICDIFAQNNFHVSSYVVYHKTTSSYTPTYHTYRITPDFGWVVFPFEKL